jgi:hypothetical protein
MNNKELARITKKMSKMSKGERASKYLELSDQGISESISGFLAFDNGGSISLHLALANELEDELAEMTTASREDALDLIRLLRS